MFVGSSFFSPAFLVLLSSRAAIQRTFFLNYIFCIIENLHSLFTRFAIGCDSGLASRALIEPDSPSSRVSLLRLNFVAQY